MQLRRRAKLQLGHSNLVLGFKLGHSNLGLVFKLGHPNLVLGCRSNLVLGFSYVTQV